MAAGSKSIIHFRYYLDEFKEIFQDQPLAMDFLRDFRDKRVACADRRSNGEPSRTHKESHLSTKLESLPRILIVDDETAQCRALVDLLSQQGYETVGCGCPRDALENQDLATFDLLISDLQMPGMSGTALIQAALAVNPHLAAILMTGHASVDSAVLAMRNGAVDYVVKPFRLSTILMVVRRALDVCELRRSNAALQGVLQRQNEELLLVNKELDAFAARLSHDLRGPIHSMRGVLSALSMEGSASLPDDLLQMVYMGIGSGDVALKMVRDLLDFARLGSRDMPMDMVDLSALIEITLPALRAQMPSQGCDIVVGKMPVVWGHEGLLQQAFLNLVGNGIKYSGNHPKPRVEVSCDLPSDGFHTIRISDNGVGFDPSQVSQLFKPFQRLHADTQFKGEGMGLANVKRIVERHGGKVFAEGCLGHGATFKVMLPTDRRSSSEWNGPGSNTETNIEMLHEAGGPAVGR